MSIEQKTIAKLKKANDLAKLAFRKNGPKSFKNGVGKMVIALYEADGTLTQRELVDVLGMGRKGVKTIVKKGVRAELVEIGEADEKKTYTVALTEQGKAVAEKRLEADKAVAASCLAGFSAEEIEQLNALCDKIIVNVKESGINGKKKAAFRHSHKRKHAMKKCRK